MSSIVTIIVMQSGKLDQNTNQVKKHLQKGTFTYFKKSNVTESGAIRERRQS